MDLTQDIVCIGWGSLIWNPGSLPLDGGWHDDGPVLPVEFARQSRDGHLTLVLLASAPDVTTLWAKLAVGDLDDAREALRVREGTVSNRIGYWPAEPTNAFEATIDAWASAKRVRGLVWTALPPRFAGENGRAPTLEEAIGHLSGLGPEARAKAEEYVRKAPVAITTPYRQAFERNFGWRAGSGT